MRGRQIVNLVVVNIKFFCVGVCRSNVDNSITRSHIYVKVFEAEKTENVAKHKAGPLGRRISRANCGL